MVTAPVAIAILIRIMTFIRTTFQRTAEICNVYITDIHIYKSENLIIWLGLPFRQYSRAFPLIYRPDNSVCTHGILNIKVSTPISLNSNVSFYHSNINGTKLVSNVCV